MRYIALLFLLTISSTLNAQEQHTKYAYCEVQPVCSAIPFGFEIYVDLGLRQPGFAFNQIVVRNSESGKRQGFDSRMQALNFMLGRGWELVEIFSEGESANPIYFFRFPLNEWVLEDFLLEEAKALYADR